MKKLGIITLVATAITFTAFTLSNLWKVVNKDEVKVNFQLVGEGTKGTFTGIDATIDFDPTDLSKSSITASVNVKSVDTGDKGRDEHILNPDFFDAEKYPTISFKSTEIVKSDNGFTAKGKLTMKDKTLDVDVPFKFVEEANGNAVLKGKMEVFPFQFGVFRSKKAENETVAISVEIPLTK